MALLYGGCGPSLAHSSYVPNSPSQSFSATVSCRCSISPPRELFYLALSGSFPVETMLRGDRSLMDDVPVKGGVISVGLVALLGGGRQDPNPTPQKAVGPPLLRQSDGSSTKISQRFSLSYSLFRSEKLRPGGINHGPLRLPDVLVMRSQIMPQAKIRSRLPRCSTPAVSHSAGLSVCV